MNSASDLVDLEYKFNGSDLPYGKSVQDLPPHKNSIVDSVLINKIRGSRSVESVSYNPKFERKDKTAKLGKNRFDCGYVRITLASAFIKLVANEGRLYVAHNSAGSYASMLKMLKHYDFGYHSSSNSLHNLVPGRKLSFSSYPGMIHSSDDFYIIWNGKKEQKFVVTGVPITVFDDSLWQYATPENQVR